MAAPNLKLNRVDTATDIDDWVVGSEKSSSKAMTQEKPPQEPDGPGPPPILQPLISELLCHIKDPSDSIKFERLESLLITLMRSCSKAEGSKQQVSDYLVANSDLLNHFSTLANDALKGKIVSGPRVGGLEGFPFHLCYRIHPNYCVTHKKFLSRLVLQLEWIYLALKMLLNRYN